MAGFEDLKVWQRSVDLSVDLYVALKHCTDGGFKDQLTRSGLSVPSNIAEGMERATIADQCKFLNYARSSCSECRTQVIVGKRAGLLRVDDATRWETETREISAMISGLIRSIRKSET
ncbi:four helix bundle protein [Crateriforma conspicua]|uniref:four helix bundle protein n=1 Tax=Crateriforma conspicua TaxID=2527996 RepID=UPI0011A32F27|nr:four helix bundle protein [Crateriforma conspicua]